MKEKFRALAIGKCERLQYEEYGKKSYISHTNILNVRQSIIALYASKFVHL